MADETNATIGWAPLAESDRDTVSLVRHWLRDLADQRYWIERQRVLVVLDHELVDRPPELLELSPNSGLPRALGLAEALTTAPDTMLAEGVREIGREIVALLEPELRQRQA